MRLSSWARRHAWTVVRVGGLLVLLGVLLVTGLWDGSFEFRDRLRGLEHGPGRTPAGHVYHGVGIDPEDSAPHLATHDGLFEVGKDGPTPASAWSWISWALPCPVPDISSLRGTPGPGSTSHNPSA